MDNKETITVQATVKAPAKKVWKLYTGTEHVTHWNNASDDWHTPRAENDLKAGGKFLFRMEAKDGSAGFDFSGVYDEVETNKLIAYTMDDGRKAKITFTGENDKTTIAVTFEAENENSIEMQRSGWQAILDNFKKYADA